MKPFRFLFQTFQIVKSNHDVPGLDGESEWRSSFRSASRALVRLKRGKPIESEDAQLKPQRKRRRVKTYLLIFNLHGNPPWGSFMGDAPWEIPRGRSPMPDLPWTIHRADPILCGAPYEGSTMGTPMRIPHGEPLMGWCPTGWHY